MINERIIRKLKQTNISTNSEKTKARVHELWKASSKSQKHAVEKAAGISRATIYRVYNTGSISAKLVVPIAQNFNVDPNYLTGKSDIKGECTDALLLDFLTNLGYEKLLADVDRGKRRAKDKSPAIGTISGMTDEEIEYVKTSEASAINNEDLSFEDLSLLLQALLLRERAGVEAAADKMSKIKALLLN